ncbi:MAG: CRISPR-associated endoribonuclease Cas6 [Ignavibacteriaceae bacterium]|nr:CRISPR-associated endoribonuclease Cas6 [Ignavibacteriaceae bacterium]
MRLKLRLKSVSGDRFSINYNHPLSSAIYLLLKFGSKEFASYLHDVGYPSGGKTYKLFTFALSFKKFTIENGLFKLNDPECYLHISSPLIEEFVKNFLIGTFERTQFYLSSRDHEIKFSIEQAELIPEPHYRTTMKLKLLSPMVLSKVIESEAGTKQYYLRPGDTDDINRVLSENLKNKYQVLTNSVINDGRVEIEWDGEYLRRKKTVTKKITINEHNLARIDVIGIQAPFSITGSPELIRTGYQCGFGEKNSMGMGMAEVIR